jgi:hypothetical protein
VGSAMPYDLRIDLAKNRLYLTLTGLMDDEETRIAADACIEAFKKLKPGFGVVNDISAFRPLTKAGVAHVQRAGEVAVKLGITASVRVTGVSPTAHQQFERAAKSGGMTTYTARNVAEAEALLDAHKP